MSEQALPEDPKLTSTDEQPRAHIRRRKTFQDYVNTVGGLVAILATTAAGISYAAGKMPWLKIEVYAKDKVDSDARIFRVETFQQAAAADLAMIKRNGLLTIQLQLQQKIDGLTSTLRTMPPSNPNYYSVSSTRDELQQQVDEIKRQLGR